jgi:hypothetical protein
MEVSSSYCSQWPAILAENVDGFLSVSTGKCQNNTVANLLKARTVKPTEAAIAREWLYKHIHCQAAVS